jgi:hypothetical protein
VAITNFLDPATSEMPVRQGDVVFDIAKLKSGWWMKKEYAHVGIAVSDSVRHRLNDPVQVIHMTLECIAVDIWAEGRIGGDSCINLSGTKPDTEDVKRAKIIQLAVDTYETRPSIIMDGISRYWMGDPNHSSHPLFPDIEGFYSFTCATFVHDCYVRAVGPLVDLTNIPQVSDPERVELLRFFGRFSDFGPSGLRGHVQQTPFRRLFPAFLAHAFRLESYPLRSNDWEALRDHGFFVPPRPDSSPSASATPSVKS